MALKKSQLYSSIWQACDELRGGMDASQYKDYVLIMLFVRYVSDKYSGKADSLVIIPKNGSFKDFVALKGKPNIGEGINKVLDALAEANGLSGVINSVDFDDEEKLGKGKEKQDRLSKLVAIFENPDLDFSKNKADGDDLLGDAYEYLMKHFAVESGKSKGQFYTPAEVSRIMAKVIGANKAKDRTQSVYDPTCGSGSLLLKVASEAKPIDISIYGQEKENTTAALAILNMWLHGEPEAVIKKGQSTLSDPLFLDNGKLKTFDFVVANPPFSYKAWRSGFTPESDDYERFDGFGIPPSKNGDYAFLLHIVKSIKSTGKGACILPHGVLFRGNTEADIRTNLLKRGYIEGIIGLPANLFYGTGIPACIIVLDKENTHDREGIFLIDASKGFVKDGNKNSLREQDIKRIVDIWESKEEVEKYSHLATNKEIEKNEYNLNLPRYIDSSEEDDIQDIEAHLKGGIPEHDIDLLQKYWNVYPTMRNEIFSDGSRDGYYKLNYSSDEIVSEIQGHGEFIEFKRKVKGLLKTWGDNNVQYLMDINLNTPPKSVIEKISQSLLDIFKDILLINKYDVYQHLMTYWEEIFQDDVYVITADDWNAGNEVIRLYKEDKKGKRKDIAGLDGLEGHLIPVSLMINTYFKEEKNKLEKSRANLEQISQEISELVDENSGDEGLLSDVVNEKGNITKGELNKRLKEIESDTDAKDEYELLRKYSDLSNRETEGKRNIKELESEIERKVLEKYPTLSLDEIKDLVVNRKWMRSIEKGVLNEVTKLSQSLTRRIKELSDRYSETLPEISEEVKDFENKVKEHLVKMGFNY
jgi:type I restriction enzyme M protein